MAAGCVPVVINKGGQPEIVEHGVSGFVWETLDELRDYTTRLIHDDALRAKMAEVSPQARASLQQRDIRLKFCWPITALVFPQRRKEEIKVQRRITLHFATFAPLREKLVRA